MKQRWLWYRICNIERGKVNIGECFIDVDIPMRGAKDTENERGLVRI